MTVRYYVKLRVGDTYGESTCDEFYAEQPFDNIEAAQEWCAMERQSGWNNWYEASIYECRDSLLTAILTCDYHDTFWKAVPVAQ